MKNYLLEAYKKIYLKENIEPDEVEKAIENRERILINYKSKGEDKNMGARMIEIYAYGLSLGGNPVIRAFQPFGDTTTRTPNWKFFRLDRITSWKPTGQHFNAPPNEKYNNLGAFNPKDDKSMSVIYRIVNFDKQYSNSDSLRDQLKNPIFVKDIWDKKGWAGAKENDFKSNNNQGREMSPDYIKSQDNLQNVKNRYNNDISSRFVSNDTIKQRLGIDSDAPMDDETKKRIQMERDWEMFDKKNARMMDKYLNNDDQYYGDLQKFTQDDDDEGSESMKKLNQLYNLKR